MIGDRILGDRYVFCAAGSAGSFGEINGLTLPKHVMFSLLDPVDVGLHLLIIPDRHGLPEFLE